MCKNTHFPMAILAISVKWNLRQAHWKDRSNDHEDKCQVNFSQIFTPCSRSLEMKFRFDISRYISDMVSTFKDDFFDRDI